MNAAEGRQAVIAPPDANCLARLRDHGAQITRETFFSFWWACVRENLRIGVCHECGLAMDFGNDQPWTPWDRLPEDHRRRLRAELLKMLEAHEANRKRQRDAGAY